MTDQPPDHDPEIVNERISDPAVGSDASSHDPDDHWLETVLTSLPERSREAREALLKALLDGAARGNPAGLTIQGVKGSMPLLAPAIRKA